MQSGKLRREKLVLFLSKRIDVSPPATTSKTAIADHYRRILAQFNEAFDQHRRVIVSLFEPHGCGISAMSTEDLFRYYATFLNPSYLKRDNYDPIGQFREDESVQQNCWHQGVQAGRNFGFFADGFYHNLVILKRRPQRTRRGIFWALTSLPFRDYTITVNLYPQNIRKEIDRTEKSLERVRGDYHAEGKHSLLTSKEVKEERINELARGDVTPFKYDFVVHVWDGTEDGLISKTRQIEAAFGQMEDAQCWTSNISSAATTKNIWYHAEALLEQNQVLKKRIDAFQQKDSTIQNLQGEIERLKKELESRPSQQSAPPNGETSDPSSAKPDDFSKVNTLDFTDPSEIMLFPRSEADYQAFLISQMRLNDELSAELCALERRRFEVLFGPSSPSRSYLALTTHKNP